MHGRVKIIQTAEQERARKLKKDQISKEFSEECEKLWMCREKEDFNEMHLEKIGSLIETSPDTATLWNYRREIIMHLLRSYSEDQEKVSKLFESELNLTTRCLYSSPKSYTVWYHRSWVMNNHTSPNWESELKLCNQALTQDERNFHCWDYRRFVVSRGRISTELELEFTDSAIEKNMSNYSAWHYRGELLASTSNVSSVSSSESPNLQIQLDKKQSQSRFDFSVPNGELDLVHNAIFTDPADQSPWFYYWWLLGRGEKKVYLRELYISRKLGRFVLVFSSVKLIQTLKELQVSIKVFPCDGTISNSITLTPELLGGWNSVLDEQLSAVWWLPLNQDLVSRYAPDNDRHLYQCRPWNVVAQVWIRKANSNVNQEICENMPENSANYLFLQCCMNSHQNESLTRVTLDPLRLLNPMILPSHDPKDLVGELNIVRDLLSFEPKNKWALLTLVSLLRFIRPHSFHEEVNEALNVLVSVDAQRSFYYEHLRSLYAALDVLAHAYENQSREVVLHHLDMSCFRNLDWYTLMTKIDFSNNSIVRIPDTFSYLISVLELNLDDNQLVTLNGISRLPSLTNLSVQRNRLCTFESIEDLVYCPSLRVVYINGNEVVKLPQLSNLISKHPGFQRQGDSFSLVYDKTFHH
ncbi:putative rab geranylgeranyl transferase alpha subunit [Schistosoma mansoni]|uniref:Geranylgeranyl transferase type-2 subunit alpha n=1 Tax=Schistosoma mansoni TaxID=6183 RepID=G4VDB2_SCHMA|nr:putative rab geranylgeranyl transferase alpha subunit [Schistosoma mansoni]|eukprot:XP_018650506.1 putative rab geranylgeranyl transferase alpha subunit [Schistosoma mansoni]